MAATTRNLRTARTHAASERAAQADSHQTTRAAASRCDVPPPRRRRRMRAHVSARTLAPVEHAARTVREPCAQGGLWVVPIDEPANVLWLPVPMQGIPLSVRPHDGSPHVIVRELHADPVAWSPTASSREARLIAYVRVPAGTCAFLYHLVTHRHLVLEPGAYALQAGRPGGPSQPPSVQPRPPSPAHALAVQLTRRVRPLMLALLRHTSAGGAAHAGTSSSGSRR